jgi:hypothetical protein
LWESDADKRRQLIEREQLLIDSIDDVLAADIVSTRTDRHGQTMWPWLYR